MRAYFDNLSFTGTEFYHFKCLYNIAPFFFAAINGDAAIGFVTIRFITIRFRAITFAAITFAATCASFFTLVRQAVHTLHFRLNKFAATAQAGLLELRCTAVNIEIHI